MKVAEQVNGIFGNLICQQVQYESDMGETMVEEKLGANRGLENIFAPFQLSNIGEI